MPCNERMQISYLWHAPGFGSAHLNACPWGKTVNHCAWPPAFSHFGLTGRWLKRDIGTKTLAHVLMTHMDRMSMCVGAVVWVPLLKISSLFFMTGICNSYLSPLTILFEHISTRISKFYLSSWKYDCPLGSFFSRIHISLVRVNWCASALKQKKINKK